MTWGSYLYLVQLVLMYGIHEHDAQLPTYVLKRNCSDLTNDNEWHEASTHLYCLHNLTSTQTGNVYHCLPNFFLNETVEFCGRGKVIPPGHCPIYSDKVRNGRKMFNYNCSKFMYGCPTISYISKDVRLYPACLKLNPKLKCFTPEEDCIELSTNPSTEISTSSTGEENNANSAVSPTSTTSTKTDENKRYSDGMELGSTISPVLTTSNESKPISTDKNYGLAGEIVATFISGLVVGVLSMMFYYYKFLHPKLKSTTSAQNSDHGENEAFLNPNDANDSTIILQNEMRERTSQHVQIEDIQKINIFLEETGGSITDDTWQSMKDLLLDVMNAELVGKMKITSMLTSLSKLLNLQFNMHFLAWIFEKCEECGLAKKCLEFSEENEFHFEVFHTEFNPCEGNRYVKIFQPTVQETNENWIKKLRLWIAELFEWHPGQILITAFEADPIAVTFLVKEKIADELIAYLKTDDGQIDASGKNIKGIYLNGEELKFGEVVKGNAFVHARFECQNINEDNVKNATASLIKNGNVQMDGSTVYIRYIQPEQKGKENDGENPVTSFIDNNRDSLLENLEPKSASKLASIFDKDDLTHMFNIKERRNRAERFLEMCQKVSMENNEMILSYLKRQAFVSLPTESSSDEDLGNARRRIEENRDDLLDEMDSDFITTTINHMEYVPKNNETLWLDSSKSRKERAKAFLEFVLQKDEYVKAFLKTTEEKEIEF